MPISATMILDSRSASSGHRLSTLKISLPKVLLAEFNTHRVFSRNFSSSRAIPNTRVINELESFYPLYYGKNQAGMQASIEEIEEVDEARLIWEDAIKYCQKASSKLADLGLHKQWANRMNDWHIFAHGIISATEFTNFFQLRIHAAAQPEMKALAETIYEALYTSTPEELQPGEWHLPFIHDHERESYSIDTLKKISTARCCRVSYHKTDGELPSKEEDILLYDRLMSSVPRHSSPAEHQATPDSIISKKLGYQWANPYKQSNFIGWIQNRRFIEDNQS